MISKLSLLFLFINVLFCDGKLFKIAWMVPGVKSKCPINIGTSGAALTLAVNAVTKNPSILNGHQIGLKTFETECDSGSGMVAAMTAQNSYDPDVFIGPPCRDAMQTVAKYGAFWNLPVLSWYNPDRLFDNYQNMIRLHPPMKYLAKSLVQILGDMKETQVTLVHDVGEQWTALNDAVESQLAKSHIHVLYTLKYTNTLSDVDLDHLLLQLKAYGTTIVFMMPNEDVRRCMLSIVGTGMIAEQFRYIHLDSQIYSDVELNTKVLGDAYWKTGHPTDQDAKRAYSQLLHVVMDPMTDDQVTSYTQPRSRYTDFIKLGKTLDLGNNTGFGPQNMAKLDVHALYLYDAVSIWSVLTDQMLSQNMSNRNGKAMVQQAMAFQAEGSTGFITLDAHADRIGKVFVLEMNKVGAFTATQAIRFDAAGGMTVTPISAPPQKGKPTSSSLPKSALAKTTNPSVTTLDPLQVIIDRLAKLEKALNKVLHHDHTRDHPPHELPQPYPRPNAPYPNHPPHSHPHAHPPHPHPPPPPPTTPKRKTKASRAKNTSPPAQPKAPVDTLAAQLIAQLTGVIDQRLGSRQPKKIVKTTPAPTTTTTAAPPPPKNSEQGGINTEYTEMMNTLREELSPEMASLMGFGMGATAANPGGAHQQSRGQGQQNGRQWGSPVPSNYWLNGMPFW